MDRSSPQPCTSGDRYHGYLYGFGPCEVQAPEAHFRLDDADTTVLLLPGGCSGVVMPALRAGGFDNPADPGVSAPGLFARLTTVLGFGLGGE